MGYFLIHWQPFYYSADIGIDVGITYTLDLGLGSKTYELELNADLSLEGPPTHGIARVNCWLFSCDIEFGTSPSNNKAPLKWPAFTQLLNSNSNESFQPFKVDIVNGLANNKPNDASISTP